MIIEEITENTTGFITRKLSSPDDEYSYFLSQGEKYHKASEDFRDAADDNYSRLRGEFSQEELEKYSKEEKNDLKKQYAEIAYGFYLQACCIADRKRLNDNDIAEISIRKSLAHVAYLRGDIFQAQLFALNAIEFAFFYVKKSSNSLMPSPLLVKNIYPSEVKQYYISLLTDLYYFLKDIARNNGNEFYAENTIDKIKKHSKIYPDSGYIDMDQLNCNDIAAADETNQLISNSAVMRLPPVKYDESNKNRIRRTRLKEYAKVAAVFGVGMIFIGLAIAWQIGNIFFPLMGDFLPAVPGAVWGALGLVIYGAAGIFAFYRGNKRRQKTKKTIQDMKDVDDLIEKAFQSEKEPQQFVQTLVEMEFTKESLRLTHKPTQSVDKLLKYGIPPDNIAYLVFLVAKMSVSWELRKRAIRVIDDANGKQYSNSCNNDAVKGLIRLDFAPRISSLQEVLQRLKKDKELNPTKYKNVEKYFNEMELTAHVIQIWQDIYKNQRGNSDSSWNKCQPLLEKEKKQQRLTAIFSSLLAIDAPGELEVPRILQVLSPRFVELEEQVNQKEVIHPDKLLGKADVSSSPMSKRSPNLTDAENSQTDDEDAGKGMGSNQKTSPLITSLD